MLLSLAITVAGVACDAAIEWTVANELDYPVTIYIGGEAGPTVASKSTAVFSDLEPTSGSDSLMVWAVEFIVDPRGLLTVFISGDEFRGRRSAEVVYCEQVSMTAIRSADRKSALSVTNNMTPEALSVSDALSAAAEGTCPVLGAE